MSEYNTFRLYLIRQGGKISTIEQDVSNVRRFLLAKKNVDDYILTLIDSGKKHSYLNNIVKALRKYGQFTNNQELQNLKFFKRQETDKAIMSQQEINDFLHNAPSQYIYGIYHWHYYKMNLFWKCLAYSGARTGEIAGLRVEDVDFGAGVFRVDGKTGKRNVPISHKLVSDLEEHIKELQGSYLFPSMRTDRPIERSTWNYDFRERLKRLGIKREHLTPYSLRHSFITRMLDEDVNLFKVQKIVGHKRIETTAHYTHLTTKDIIATLKLDPLSRCDMPFYDRLRAFRNDVRKLVGVYAVSVEEEKELLEAVIA